MMLAFFNCQCFGLFVSFEHLEYRLFNALPYLVLLHELIIFCVKLLSRTFYTLFMLYYELNHSLFFQNTTFSCTNLSLQALKSELEKASPSLGRSAVYVKDSRINDLPRYDTKCFHAYIFLLMLHGQLAKYMLWFERRHNVKKKQSCSYFDRFSPYLLHSLNFFSYFSQLFHFDCNFLQCGVSGCMLLCWQSNVHLFSPLYSVLVARMFFMCRYLTIQFVRFFWKRESNQKAKILRVCNTCTQTA